MKPVDLDTIRGCIDDVELIDAMRDPLMAQSRGECDTPMPMHLAVPAEDAQIHIKSSYREGGGCFAMKVASTFPNNRSRGISTSNGMSLLFSAVDGEPLAYFADRGEMTDLRTAAVAAMMTKALGRTDSVLGIIGAGLQGRLQARMHAAVLPLQHVYVHDVVGERMDEYAADVGKMLPGVTVHPCVLADDVAAAAKLIVTVTPARTPHLAFGSLQPGTHINAVGADTAGKHELANDVLEEADLVLVDSLAQCEHLGELQHVPAVRGRAVEIGAFLADPCEVAPDAITVADFTGLGVEDLAIAEYVWNHLQGKRKP
jgi:ornithine cyclodeaminase